MAGHEITDHFYNTKTLVEFWRDFIDWEKRRRGENGFLEKALRAHKCRKVFEACLGEGCDGIHLARKGFEVTGNEVDSLFMEKARENAESENTTLKFASHDWREMDKSIPKAGFDAVLCLGNSLTYLFREHDQRKALENFRFLLRKGGILVIDERNYQYFLDERKRILRGNFRYSGKYVYCGTRVHGRPVEIEDNKVVMEYTDSGTGKKAYLVLYPFRKGELLSLLKKAGFRRIQLYSDYRKGFNRNADFYQYVAVK